MKNAHKIKTQTQVRADQALKDMFSVKRQTSSYSTTTYSNYSGSRPKFKKKQSVDLDLTLLIVILITILSMVSFTYSAHTNFIAKPKPRIIEGID